MFMEGRCADVIFDGKAVGALGEIIPLALENFKLRIPVAAFEINLLAIIKDKYSTTSKIIYHPVKEHVEDTAYG
jgi:phenylalanyl-tRNA synthetase beta subunit